jgi:hypothetical protein
LKVKEREKEEEALHIEDTKKLVTEIELPRIVLYIMASRNNRRS